MASLTLVVLSGGRGKRLGEYKPLAKLCDRPLVCWVLDNLAPLSGERLLIVHETDQAKEIKSAAKKCGHRVSIVTDLPGENLPLTGLYTASLYSTGEILLVAPADTPFLKAGTYRRLLEKLGSHDAAVPRWPQGYLEPLIAVYRAEALRRAARQSIEAGKKRSMAPLAAMDVVYVPVEEAFENPEVETFNINSPEDLRRAESVCRERVRRLQAQRV